jgi:hypothetical protein
MATLQTIVERLPRMWQLRYGSADWINYANELLELLSAEGMMKDVDHETGIVPASHRWLTKPTGCRDIIRICHPADDELTYGFIETEGKIKLDREIEDDDASEAITTFSSYLTTAVTVNISDALEDEFEDWLLVISTGTLAGNTYLISGNDASSGGTCKIYFEHTLSAAFDGTKVVTGYLTGPDHFVLFRYKGSYTEISSYTDQVPIDDKYERRLTEAWLRFKCEFNAARHSQETQLSYQYFNDVLSQVQSEMLRKPTVKMQGRNLPLMIERKTYRVS